MSVLGGHATECGGCCRPLRRPLDLSGVTRAYRVARARITARGKTPPRRHLSAALKNDRTHTECQAVASRRGLGWDGDGGDGYFSLPAARCGAAPTPLTPSLTLRPADRHSMAWPGVSGLAEEGCKFIISGRNASRLGWTGGGCGGWGEPGLRGGAQSLAKPGEATVVIHVNYRRPLPPLPLSLSVDGPRHTG